MHPALRMDRRGRRARTFDVICAGEALWKLTGRDGPVLSKAPRVSLGGGPVAVALALAGEGLHVGLATIFADDTFGRGHAKRIAAAGVDIGGVAFAVLVVSDGNGGAVATGPFGDVAFVPPQGTRLRTTGAGDACTAAICAELTRHGEPGESPSARWFRALQGGHAAASATA